MKLLPLDNSERIELAAGWLAQKDNYQWLNFGAGRQPVTPAVLRIMAQRETHFMRLYTAGDDDTPIGIAAVNDVDRVNLTATLWGATGDKAYRYRGYATYAGSVFLSLVFRQLGLQAINTWVVEHNPSLRLVQRLGFRPVGRLRRCHCIDGRLYDRLHFDLLAEEHVELDAGWPARAERKAREREQV